jgi:hypothetical protein
LPSRSVSESDSAPTADAVRAADAVSAGVAVVVWVGAEEDALWTLFRGVEEEHPEATSMQTMTEQATRGIGSRRRYTKLLQMARGLAILSTEVLST